jgi:hypothetical protein
MQYHGVVSLAGISGLGRKLVPVLQSIISEITMISWLGLVTMISIGGVLMLTGNEYGAKKVCKHAIYGFILIQLANMLI